MTPEFFKKYENGPRALGSRSATTKIALSLLAGRKNVAFVETGTTRKNLFNSSSVEERAADGSSTLVFADYAKRFGGSVLTCDINPDNIQSCKIATKEYEGLIEYIVGDSVDILDRISFPIDFLYLDSVDSHLPSANEHQLQEIQAAYKNLHPKSIVLLDDLGSKTQLSSHFLKQKNWCQILIGVPRPSHYNNIQQGLFVHESFLWTDHSLVPEHQRYKDE